ncbi:SGNH/GDSL hydrolase family protein [Cryptosporangium arvum]|uniref:Lysophospholipase L1-like esterase n=1 Tax=Cryptosporangium arvum DSM 44712 TaxID=927661 RepID=A0A010ZSD4_9ACTN|nr:SGNH/GDSL hydrolase family protein [Cryptosporangium arvum]EXG80132.1 lysophospholipase L1-like esterase [Cryptosporangium arvum DSM 44712]
MVGDIRFAALGDSVTEGLGDPRPGGGWRGWAALLAEGWSSSAFVNYAASGATTARVLDEQLPSALAFRPTVASVVVGVNDVLRPGFDAAAIEARLDHVVGSLCASGAVVLTARMPDPGRMLRLPGALRRPLGRRTLELNGAVQSVAERHRTVHVDLADHPAVADRAAWHVDRLHPNERGHRVVAREFAGALSARGLPVERMPSAEPGGGRSTRPFEHVWWLATKGTGWVIDRGTDLVPHLLGMAAREFWSAVRSRRRDGGEPGYPNGG